MPSYPRMAAFCHNYSGKPAHGQAALVFWCCMSAASLPAWPLMTSPQVGQRIVIVHPFRPLTSASKKGVGAACPVALLVLLLLEDGIGGSSSSTCSHSSPAAPRVLLPIVGCWGSSTLLISKSRLLLSSPRGLFLICVFPSPYN